MKPSVFWNDILTKGAILGGVMLLSSLVETSMLYYGGSTLWAMAMSAVMIIAFAIYVWLSIRFTRNYAKLVLAERKEMPYFTYGNALAYVTCISMLAGVIVALGGYMFRHYVIGYEEYIAANVKLMQEALSTTEVPASMVGTYDEMFRTLKSQDEPSLIATVLSSVWSYLVLGTFVGLIAGAVTQVKPKIFDNTNSSNEQ